MESIDLDETIRLLHLSDLHLGLANQEWMWPTFRTALYDDLRNMHARTGPWDVVVFSGDLTQRGSSQEFEQLTTLLAGLWSHFKDMGSEPKLFVVPGNHDLVRPPQLDPIRKVMASWWTDDAVQTDFWKSSASLYRAAVASWFLNYQTWVSSVGNVLPMLNAVQGLLPGDISATFEKGSRRLGLIGLNSAWLQHSGGDYLGHLCVHPRQLMEVTAGDPDAWCGKHDFRLLVTHHPVAWLHPSAQNDWTAEITAHGRFHVHLFGHMHEGQSRSESVSGGPTRHSIQAASLFGLEYFGEGNATRRDHGYSVMHVPAAVPHRAIRIWPRVLKLRKGSSARLVADQSWDLLEDAYCDLVMEPGTAVGASTDRLAADPLTITTDMPDVLSRLTRSTVFNEAHAAVRKGDQSVFLAALKEKRQAWLVTDWGLAGNEFIETVQLQLIGRRGAIYCLDLHKFRTQEEVVEGLPERIGCSFARLCTGLAEQGQAILILDDVEIEPAGSGTDGAASMAQQVHGLVKVILDFCPDLAIVVRSRAAPAVSTMQVVELSPLDEADTALYLAAHPQGGAHLAKHDTAMRLHRHTDGIPSQIDVTLRDMNIVGLKDIFELDTDVAGKHVGSRDVSPGLVRTIKELSEAKDDVSGRSFTLLKVLSMFPQGEQLSRVKRFYGARAFYPVHASLLVELSLIDVVFVTSLGTPSTAHEQGRALVVRRPVRDYVIQSLSDPEHRTLSAKALSLYFGDVWEVRGIRPQTDLRFKDSRCDAREIGNACTMVLRTTRSAIDSGVAAKIKSVLTLATAFVAQLLSGAHYRSIAALYDDLLPLHERTGLALDLELARLQHAQALRMIGEHHRSLDLLKLCEQSVKTKAMKQRVLLNLALVSESLKLDPAEILKIARQAEEIDTKTNAGLQARAIAIAHDESNRADRDSQLHQLQEEALKRKAFVVLNNLAIERAEKVKDPEIKKQILQGAVHIARRENDAYNFIRASLGLAALNLDEAGALQAGEMVDCTRAYTYLFNQRMDSLFNKCHGILWRAFKVGGDVDKMLKLFRHSSLVWRLRGQVGVERGYITQLLPLLGQGARTGLLTADRNMVYFLTRSVQLSTEDPTVALPDESSRPCL